MIKIDHGIPIPTTRRDRVSKYPFDVLKKGDSFLVHGKTSSTFGGNIQYYRAKYGLSKRFKTRTIGANVRVWRVK